jgi:hypothetical protein
VSEAVAASDRRQDVSSRVVIPAIHWRIKVAEGVVDELHAQDVQLL